MDSLTVVIPTYNRAPILKMALEAYIAQRGPAGVHELVVVDDGSTDNTELVVSEIGRKAPFPVRYFRQDNKGPAAARNLGIREAHADLILFTDSDIVPREDLVQQHLQWHRGNRALSTAVLGCATWPLQPAPTPFMRWYGERGALFAFGKFRRGQRLSFLNFYTCNVSLKTEFLRTYGQFDEAFKSAAYEDIELGYRLAKAGLQLTYNPDAVGYHYQFFRFEDACRKAYQNAAAKEVFLGKEAGQYILARRKTLKYRIGKVFALCAASILTPLKGCLDSRMRLPSVIYRLLYWHHTAYYSDSCDSRVRTWPSMRQRGDVIR